MTDYMADTVEQARFLLSSLRTTIQETRRQMAGPSPLSRIELDRRLAECDQVVAQLQPLIGMDANTQLVALYELSGAINASLELSKTLNLVMDAMIHLTGAERGFLMLYNDDSGVLEVQVARNVSRETIDGTAFEISRSIVRDVVEHNQAVLTTNAQMDPRYSDHESVVGYQLRSMLCAPLSVSGRVIGAIYLDNRVKSGAFSEWDRALLVAFANQAAVAIENARLHTLTDRQLQERVNELSTMQRIDEQLNDSLDFDRVMELALTWCARATQAAGAALGLLDEDGVMQVHARVGQDNGYLSQDMVGQLLQTAAPVMSRGTHLMVPICREGKVIGLFDLLAADGGHFKPPQVEFAARIATRSAVAIENARLYEQVRQANLAKSEFISFVSHELRTPMTSMRGYADMLAKGMAGPLNDQQMNFVNTIRANVERMRILVSDLLEISRIESGRLQLELEPVTLLLVVEDALKAVRGQIEERGQTLTLNVPADLPAVLGDPARLTQVLTNLLSNASKYTPEGGSISVRALQQNGSGSLISCAVTDTGIGMTESDRAHLFTKFFRSEDPAVREMPGTGLGLCITKNLVEMHGGALSVESQVGAGSTFCFTLPVVPV